MSRKRARRRTDAPALELRPRKQSRPQLPLAAFDLRHVFELAMLHLNEKAAVVCTSMKKPQSSGRDDRDRWNPVARATDAGAQSDLHRPRAHPKFDCQCARSLVP
jgi:hypothetical protein